MIFQFVWTKTDEVYLENNVPLLWHGEHIRQRGWSNNIVIVFLEGFNNLSKDYVRLLRRLDYEVVDGSAIVRHVSKDFSEIEKFNLTRKYWFLRWNVLYELVQQRVAQLPLIHVDGDVVFMSDPYRLQQDVSKKTFVLQGCPAFTSISDISWFEVWQQELKGFLSNEKDYVAKTLREQNKPFRPNREFCNICAYSSDRPYHDQDLLEYLIAAGQIPQHRAVDIFLSSFYWIQNPLFPGEWIEEQCKGCKKQLIEQGEKTVVGNKELAFYHFQADFTRYCHFWILLNNLRLHWLLDYVKPDRWTRTKSLTGRFLNRVMSHEMLWQFRNRRAVYERVFQVNSNSQNRFITDIVNSCWS